MSSNQVNASKLPGEEWRPVHGWPYLVSNYGRVALEKTKQLKVLLQQHHREDGTLNFRFIMLKNKKRVRRAMVGTLVAEAFLGPRPTDYTIIYIDRNFNNHHASNLRYGTFDEALKHHRSPNPEVFSHDPGDRTEC